MSDIELVIKIPKEEYEMIMLKMNTSIIAKSCSEAEKIIANGTLLPKGHGRLIDASKLPLDCGAYEYGCEKICLCDDCIYAMVSLKTINNAETIIEADNKGE